MEYQKKVNEIEKRAKLTKYRIMKNLDNRNEKVPVQAKANMVRRTSQQAQWALPQWKH